MKKKIFKKNVRKFALVLLFCSIFTSFNACNKSNAINGNENNLLATPPQPIKYPELAKRLYKQEQEILMETERIEELRLEIELYEAKLNCCLIESNPEVLKEYQEKMENLMQNFDELIILFQKNPSDSLKLTQYKAMVNDIKILSQDQLNLHKCELARLKKEFTRKKCKLSFKIQEFEFNKEKWYKLIKEQPVSKEIREKILERKRNNTKFRRKNKIAWANTEESSILVN